VSKSTIAPENTDRQTYSSAAERWAEQRRLVVLVVAAYRAVKDLSPVIAFNPDPDSRSRSNRWSPDSAHYSADVSNTVRRAIESKPDSERPALWVAWANLLGDDSKLGTNEQKLIRLLAGLFFKKRLHPAIYFKPRRLTRRTR